MGPISSVIALIRDLLMRALAARKVRAPSMAAEQASTSRWDTIRITLR